jgi:hypothetical protein
VRCYTWGVNVALSKGRCVCRLEIVPQIVGGRYETLYAIADRLYAMARGSSSEGVAARTRRRKLSRYMYYSFSDLVPCLLGLSHNELEDIACIYCSESAHITVTPHSNTCSQSAVNNNNAIDANCALSALLVLQEYSTAYRARLALPPQSLLPSPPLACRAPDREGHALACLPAPILILHSTFTHSLTLAVLLALTCLDIDSLLLAPEQGTRLTKRSTINNAGFPP